MAPRSSPVHLAFLLTPLLMPLLAACSHDSVPDPRTQPPLVETVAVRAAVNDGRAFSGVVGARVQSDLGFRVAGKVLQRLVDAGQTVRGQPLMRIDPVDLGLQAHAQDEAVAAARARARQAGDDEVRYRDLVAAGAVSASAYDQVKAAADAARAQLSAAQAQAAVARNASTTRCWWRTPMASWSKPWPSRARWSRRPGRGAAGPRRRARSHHPAAGNAAARHRLAAPRPACSERARPSATPIAPAVRCGRPQHPHLRSALRAGRPAGRGAAGRDGHDADGRGRAGRRSSPGSGRRRVRWRQRRRRVDGGGPARQGDMASGTGARHRRRERARDGGAQAGRAGRRARRPSAARRRARPGGGRRRAAPARRSRRERK